MGYFKRRFGEKSTAFGLGILISAGQAYLTGGTHAAILQGLTGLMAILLPEGAAPVNSDKSPAP